MYPSIKCVCFFCVFSVFFCRRVFWRDWFWKVFGDSQVASSFFFAFMLDEYDGFELCLVGFIKPLLFSFLFLAELVIWWFWVVGWSCLDLFSCHGFFHSIFGCSSIFHGLVLIILLKRFLADSCRSYIERPRRPRSGRWKNTQKDLLKTQAEIWEMLGERERIWNEFCCALPRGRGPRLAVPSRGGTFSIWSQEDIGGRRTLSTKSPLHRWFRLLRCALTAGKRAVEKVEVKKSRSVCMGFVKSFGVSSPFFSLIGILEELSRFWENVMGCLSKKRNVD